MKYWTPLNSKMLDAAYTPTYKKYGLFSKNIPPQYENIFKFKNPTSNYSTDGGPLDKALMSSDIDGPPIILSFNRLTVNEGHTLQPTNRCKGLYIFCNQLILNGNISMSQRGCKGEGKNILIHPFWMFIAHYNKDFSLDSIYNPSLVINAYGGVGGNTNAGDGEPSQFSSGGGGAGFSTHPTHATWKFGKGSQGTSFSGGSGGGTFLMGRSGGANLAPSSAEEDGGSGGNSATSTPCNVRDCARYAGGGIGNISGRACTNGSLNNSTSNIVNGTGGSLVVIVKDIIIGNGKLESNGIAQTSGMATDFYGPGGASGGGNVTFVARYPNSITIEAKGGIAPTWRTTAGSGGDGAIRKVWLNSKHIQNI